MKKEYLDPRPEWVGYKVCPKCGEPLGEFKLDITQVCICGAVLGILSRHELVNQVRIPEMIDTPDWDNVYYYDAYYWNGVIWVRCHGWADLRTRRVVQTG